MQNVQCKLYSVQCTLYSIQCTMYSAHCTVINVVCSKYEVAYSAAGWWGGGWVMDSDEVMEMNREALYMQECITMCSIYSTVQCSTVQ